MDNCIRVAVSALIMLFAPFLVAQNDCQNAIVVCGNTGFQGLTATGVGIQEISDLNTCGSQENNSIWLKLPIQASGTLSFVLTPESTDLEEDFDFFIFGPNVTCASLGMAVRCSTTNPLMSGQFDNLTGMNAVETDTEEGPGELGNSFVQSMDVVAGEVYFMVIDRPIGESDFSIQWNGTATFESQPTIAALPQDLQTCVPSGNIGSFNLNNNFNTIMGGQGGLLLTYHVNSNDAITGENPILAPTLFSNTSNPQTIHTRLTNTTSGCFTLSEFNLTVNNGPSLVSDTFTICDDGADGNGTNGQAVFNLSSVTQSIMGAQDLTGISISYFGSLLAAQQNLVPLPPQFYNTIPHLHPLFVRMSNASGCVTIEEISLRVLPQPLAIHTTLTQCDIGVAPDGITQFDLNQVIPILTAHNSNLNVAFFETGNPIPISDLLYTNLTNPQTLQARITNNATGCQSMGSITLTANMSLAPVVTIASQCDVLGIENGMATFDLMTANLTLTATQSVTFHQLANDALLGQNEITSFNAYDNAVAYNDVVYVRIADGGNCVSISVLALVVNKLPNVARNGTAEVVCQNDPEYFVTLDAGILEGATTDYTYDWFRDGTPMGQAGHTVQVNQPGNYTVEVTRLGCTVTRTIVVSASAHANIESITVNDLITDYNTVIVNVNTSSLGEYVFALDTQTGPFQTSNVFTDVAPGIHYLYVKDLLACGIFGPIQVNVLGIPRFFTPNGDGFNDTWNINGVDAQHNAKTIIHIFDRFGKLIKQISPMGGGWDGYYLDKPAPAEDYWYTMELEDTRKAKGHFTLKR